MVKLHPYFLDLFVFVLYLLVLGFQLVLKLCYLVVQDKLKLIQLLVFPLQTINLFLLQ